MNIVLQILTSNPLLGMKVYAYMNPNLLLFLFGLSIGLGMMVYGLRTPSDKLSNDPSKWLVEGIDRSGIVSVPFYIGNILKQKSGERKLTQALGPSVGTLKDADKAISSIFKEGMTQAELDAAVRLLPGNNIIWLWAIEKAADKKISRMLGESLDLPERRKRKKSKKKKTLRRR